MLDKAQRRMTPEEFYAWQEGMDEKYELVDGHPVPRCPDIEMMTGASRRHDQIVWNVLAALKAALRGGSCRGFTADTAVRTLKGTRRRPDAGIECGSRDDESHEAGDVRVVFEVLSPSTHELDVFEKLHECRDLPTMQHIVVVEPNAPKILVWSRSGETSWTQETVADLTRSIHLRSPEITLALADIYDEIEFRSPPKLVGGGGG